jgi:hypothetical protein
MISGALIWERQTTALLLAHRELYVRDHTSHAARMRAEIDLELMDRLASIVEGREVLTCMEYSVSAGGSTVTTYRESAEGWRHQDV